MRRLALSLATIGSLAILAGCSGGTGFGNSSNTIKNIVFSDGVNGQVNDFFVAPGGTSPVKIVAVGVSSGPGADLVYGQSFTWTARFVNPKTDPASIATYVTGVAPSTFKTCPSAPAVQPAVPILVSASASTVTSGYAGYAALTAGQAVSTVWVGSVPQVAAPYCLVLTALHPSDGVVGTITVVVSNNP